MQSMRSNAFTIIILCGFFGVACANADSLKTAIATAHPLATDAGFEITAKGGNVFDAAVAVSAALAVVEPAGSGLGGGGYWLLHRVKDRLDVMIDGREKAPLAAHKDMFLNKNGKVIPKLSLDSALAAAIPGLPAGLVHLSEKYGRLPLAESLAPAIRYARNGFAITERHRRMLTSRADVLKKNPSAANIFLTHNSVPKPFAILKQPDLAITLSQLAESGKDGYYSGEIADKLLTAVRKAGGIWSQKDLDAYQIVERKPIKGSYHGINITSAPPSSSGGIVLIEALNILSGFDLQKTDAITRKHLIVEAMRRAYHDRSLYLGDSDFIDIPVQRIISLDYAAGLRSTIRPDKALHSDFLSGDLPEQNQGTQTTHFSIIDEEGNRVAATLSINMPFGSGFAAKGTGVLLNDEMDDFASLPGKGNGYGLVGGTANSIAAGKRMLSSMTPTFLETPESIAVLGTPGGSRIISMVLLAVLDFELGSNPDSWVKIPRFHHQYIPDVLEYEKGAFSADELAKLSLLGHQMKESKRLYGDMQAVQLHKLTHKLSAASDPRGVGKAWVSP
jgi:gamma-glutamyltranspeptidase/glutathione hydrolase